MCGVSCLAAASCKMLTKLLSSIEATTAWPKASEGKLGDDVVLGHVWQHGIGCGLDVL